MNGILKQEVPQGTVTRYWWISLGAGLAAIGTVAYLLNSLLRTVEQIQSTSAEIWQVGKLIANNTVHVPLLGRTNQIVEEISEAAEGTAISAERIQRATDAIARGEG